MPRILYIEASGVEHLVEVPETWSLMEGAVKHGIPGIDADCGGACACATCHIYVEPDWLTRLSPRSGMEVSMLDFAEGARPESRLACQIRANRDLDGIVVRLPQSQH